MLQRYNFFSIYTNMAYCLKNFCIYIWNIQNNSISLWSLKVVNGILTIKYHFRINESTMIDLHTMIRD